MKILLVNNQTLHLNEIKNGLSEHQLTVVDYRPGMDLSDEGFEMIILSGGGGQGSEVNDTYDYRGTLWYQAEIDFVLRTKLPVMGICMGFEVIARAFGETIDKMPRRVRDFQMLNPRGRGKDIFGTEVIKQFESHEWHLADIKQNHLKAIVDSRWGIEAFHHKDRPILATQFHPEVVGGSHSIADMVNYTVNLHKIPVAAAA